MSKHPRNKPFFCPDCGKGFRTDVGRDAHIKDWHKIAVEVADRQARSAVAP